MSRLETIKDERYFFGALFVASNRIDTMLEREFSKFDITSKQWFLSIVINNLFDAPPTIKDAAREMGSSHQNVKQIALKLEQKGLLALEKDKDDSRAIRLNPTKNSNAFWQKIRDEGNDFTKEVFEGIDNNDLAAARRVMQKILLNIDYMEKSERTDNNE